MFFKLKYPSFGNFSFFKKQKGLNESGVQIAMQKYGDNKYVEIALWFLEVDFFRFEIPIPSFQDLMKEHVIAPFFVFQIFCVTLWMMDDMWYYSLFTLVMLFVFESTVVFQVTKKGVERFV